MNGIRHLISALATVVMMAILVYPTAASAQCFADQPPKAGQARQHDAQIRNLIVAHAPIEYRKSCGLRDDSDQRYYEAVRKQTGCTESAAYESYFGSYLQDVENYVFAVRRVDLRSDDDFELYCQIVSRIDLKQTVTDDGMVRPDMLQAQVPLFDTLRQLVLTRSWQQ